MTVPVLTQKEFFRLLERNGWKILSTDYWNEYDRVIIGKDGRTVPVQCLDKYFFPIVVKLCELLEFPAPEDHQTFYDQWKQQQKGNEPTPENK